MQISSEKVSDKFLEINNCNLQQLCKSNYHMLREKGRQDHYMLYILQGVCYLSLEDGSVLPVGAGNLIYYPPLVRQEYRFSEQEDTRTAFVHFSGTACEEILKSCGFTGARVTYIGEGKPARIFREMVEEFYLKKPFFAEQTAALFLHFLSVAARRAQYKRESVNVVLQRSIDSVLRYMHRNYAESRDVAFFAEMCHLSPGRFAHVFKESTGTSPRRYFMQIKVDAACVLLANTDLSVEEVARAVGIEDANYFSRLIKKHTGRPPREQRA